MGCVEVGRVVDDRLGVLGIDGLDHDDGLFHRLAEDTVDPPFCTPLDADGHAFLADAGSDFYAAGVPPETSLCTPGRASAQCPVSDRREVLFGLTGPDGESVTYEANGAIRTEKTVGPNGAYLIVLRSPGPMALGGYIIGGPMPINPITAVSYRDGTVCRLTRPVEGARPRPCGLIGETSPQLLSNIKTPVHIAVETQGPGPYAFHVVRVSFRAPLAIDEANRSYVLEVRATAPCHGSVSQQTQEDIRKGQTVTLELNVPDRLNEPELVSPPSRGRGAHRSLPSKPRTPTVRVPAQRQAGAACGALLRGQVGLASPSSSTTAEPTHGDVIKDFVLNTHEH